MPLAGPAQGALPGPDDHVDAPSISMLFWGSLKRNGGQRERQRESERERETVKMIEDAFLGCVTAMIAGRRHHKHCWHTLVMLTDGNRRLLYQFLRGPRQPQSEAPPPQRPTHRRTTPARRPQLRHPIPITLPSLLSGHQAGEQGSQRQGDGVGQLAAGGTGAGPAKEDVLARAR
jgi:hypothetical protein